MGTVVPSLASSQSCTVKRGGKNAIFQIPESQIPISPPTPRRVNEPVGDSAPHRVGWDPKWLFPLSLRGRIFYVTEIKQVQCFLQAHLKYCRGTLSWQQVCLAAAGSHSSSVRLRWKGEEGPGPCRQDLLAKGCFSLQGALSSSEGGVHSWE